MRRSWEVSPLEVFLPRAECGRIAEAYRSRLIRRLAAFTSAALMRGRGRIPLAFREEAAALDRLERLLARWRREQRLWNEWGRTRLDWDQEEFAFMHADPPQCRRRWNELLASKPWGFCDRRGLARQLAAALENFERDRPEEKKRREEDGQLSADERAEIGRVRHALVHGLRDEALKILRHLLAA